MDTDLLLSGTSLAKEMGSDLGDARLTARLQRVGESLAAAPDASYPDVLEDPSELEGFYRFLRNGRVSARAVSAKHHEQTVARAVAFSEVAVIHDTTEFKFSVRDGRVREHLYGRSSAVQGFWGHFALVASADGLRTPLGVLWYRGFVPERQVDAATLKFWRDEFGELSYQPDRWLEGIQAAEDQLQGKATAIHLADREADIYDLLQQMTDHNYRFVFRMAQDRNASPADSELIDSMSTWLQATKFVTSRTVELSARSVQNRPLSVQKKHGERSRRRVTLWFRAVTLKLQPPALPKAKGKNGKTRPERYTPLEVNLVEAVERDPPEGESAVRWVLVTREPIHTTEDILRVVDLYRTRWLIEEYFKALKTGCSYEKRQLDSAKTLLVALAISIPVAWRLLLMRHIDRHKGDALATTVLTPLELRLLRAKYPKMKWSRQPTVAQAYAAVARLGGHLPNNGRVGWLVLGRGFAKLLAQAEGCRLLLDETDLETEVAKGRATM